MPKLFNLQFLNKAKTISTKPVGPQSTHEVCASEDISVLNFKILIPGYSWSKKFGFKPEESGR